MTLREIIDEVKLHRSVTEEQLRYAIIGLADNLEWTNHVLDRVCQRLRGDEIPIHPDNRWALESLAILAKNGCRRTGSFLDSDPVAFYSWVAGPKNLDYLWAEARRQARAKELQLYGAGK